MHQSIGRVTARDGTGIAVASVGSGRPLVYVSGWLSHLELGWRQPEERAFYEGLAEGGQLVRYDRAGCGLSGAPRHPPSLDGELDQLSAVVGPLGSEPFDLMGTSMGSLVAAAWAARHPERVRRLVLYGGWVAGEELSTVTARDSILALVEEHWGLGSDVLADIFAPDALTGSREDFARYQRASSSAATARSLLALSYALDIRDELPQVTAPTLVIHREHDRAAPVAQGAALAAGIRGARLVVLPGRSHLPYAGDAAAVVAEVRRFLGLRATRRQGRVLTPRQLDVAALIAQGRTNREIAALLGIEERSAEGHAERIRERLGVGTRSQIAAWYTAQRDGLPREVG